MKKLIVIIVVASVICGFKKELKARTRQEVINIADEYISDCTWTCDQKNLYDRYKNSTLPLGDFDPNNVVGAVMESDGIDDRQGNPPSSSRWPYYVSTTTIYGEAYAWTGGYLHSGETQEIWWGWEPYTAFLQRINGEGAYASQNWIAGKRETDSNTPPANRRGYTGIDCSGLITRLWYSPTEKGHISTDNLDDYCIQMPPRKVQKGDILLRAGRHVVLVKNWNESSKVITHAVETKFSDAEVVWRVVEEQIQTQVSGEEINIYYKEFNQSYPYKSYSPFPQFADISPSTGTTITYSTPTIKVTIRSGPQTETNENKVLASSIIMKIDGVAVIPKLSPSGNSALIQVKKGTGTIFTSIRGFYNAA